MNSGRACGHAPKGGWVAVRGEGARSRPCGRPGWPGPSGRGLVALLGWPWACGRDGVAVGGWPWPGAAPHSARQGAIKWRRGRAPSGQSPVRAKCRPHGGQGPAHPCCGDKALAVTGIPAAMRHNPCPSCLPRGMQPQQSPSARCQDPIGFWLSSQGNAGQPKLKVLGVFLPVARFLPLS